MIDIGLAAKEWATPVIAVLGFGLSVWNRIDKWREDREKARDKLPTATLSFSGQEATESETHSVRTLVVEFENPTKHRWVADHVELRVPKLSAIRSAKKVGPWSRSIEIDWTLTASGEQGDGRSNGYLQFRFERLPATDEAGPQREISLTGC